MRKVWSNLYLLIAVSGAVGALSRYLMSSFVQSRYNGSFPLGTFAVNILGCFIFGFLYTMLNERAALTPTIRSLLFIGFLGGFTTFSTWAFETLALAQEGSIAQAMANALSSMAIGLGAIWAAGVLARITLRLF